MLKFTCELVLGNLKLRWRSDNQLKIWDTSRPEENDIDDSSWYSLGEKYVKKLELGHWICVAECADKITSWSLQHWGGALCQACNLFTLPISGIVPHLVNLLIHNVKRFSEALEVNNFSLFYWLIIEWFGEICVLCQSISISIGRGPCGNCN